MIYNNFEIVKTLYFDDDMDNNYRATSRDKKVIKKK